MRFLFVLFLLLSGQALAQKKLSAQAFQVNVRPTLNAILSDFYSMIALFPDFPKDLIGIFDQLRTLERTKQELHETCPRLITENCRKSVDQLREKLRETQARTLQLVARQKLSSSFHLSSLRGLRLINEFQASLDELKGELDNLSLLQRARISYRKPTLELIQEVDALTTTVSVSMMEFIPYLYKEDFRNFYFNFVNPIQSHITKNLNYEFLNRNLDSFNFSLNLLVMNLTKRNKKTPDGMSPYLNLLHNRWNNLLRFYY